MRVTASSLHPTTSGPGGPRVYGHYIDGAFTDPSLDRVQRRAPGTGLVVAEYSRGTAQDTERAITCARRAFDHGPWPQWSGIERARVLLALADLVRQNKERLARLEAEEVGKPLRLAVGDVDGSVGLIEYAASLAMSMHGDVHTNLGSDFTAFVAREPAGVIGMITPWNFPLLLLAQKLPFALGAGCTAVVKPSELTASSTLEIARLAQEAGVPDGVINVVTGRGSVVGQHIAESVQVDVVSFTGSTEVGRRIVTASQSNLKRLSLELGGKAANIVLPDADLEDALDGVMFGVYFNNGECCVSGARLLIAEQVADEFLDELIARTARLRVGQPLEENTDIGALIHEDHLATVLEYIESADADGAAVRTGGSRLTSEPFAAGTFLAPTVLDQVAPTARVFREEIFGPVLSVTRFRDLDEAIALANSVDYGLANSVWTKDIDKALTASRALRSGTVWVNTTIDGAPQLPGGGVKMSGYGREMGQVGFDEFTEVKTVQIRTGRRTPFFGA
ncbi:aldehyde dehydrogenase family protein [Streptomyces sp. RB6PN25]|uniref:Aldehyde dehydrogenase family protein n=1 Tax=Streptomyces humicola TaxID=2953240 RepID=A0ABT1PTB7_9ACTN|nr:aldehyde dehydrogenase family protein [Streptomyces humicola]MCQ4080891.1 aldehyde dehydrogenase family protein [Streptomyces humicola]